MSAITGRVSWNGPLSSDALDAVLAKLADFGPQVEQAEVARARFGVRIGLPGKARVRAGKLGSCFAIDGEIDNSAVIARRLNAPFDTDVADLIHSLWCQSGVDGLALLEGDFALALWDPGAGRLVLAKSQESSTSLCFRRHGAGLVFASWPRAIAALDSAPDCTALAGLVLGSDVAADWRTMFAEVEAVPAGWVFTAQSNGNRRCRLWNPGSVEQVDRPDAERAEELVSLLRQSVARCVSAGDGPVGCHLSAGRDSGAVAATADELEAKSGNVLHAFTAAPQPGLPGTSNHYLFDEAPVAARVAADRPAMIHHVVRSRPYRLCDGLDSAHRLHHQPLGNPLNLPWWDSIAEMASTLKCRVLLTGQSGNFGLSAGGAEVVPDLARSGDIAAWLKVAVGWRGSWRSLLGQTAAALLPPKLLDPLRAGDARHYPFFKNELRNTVQQLARTENDQHARYRRYRDRLVDQISGLDLADKSSTIRHGVAFRDPTCDRGIFQWALSLTDRQLASSPERRPIFERAFGDHLPPEVLRPMRRGLQSADFCRVFDPKELRDGLRRYRRHSVVREWIDLKAIDCALDRWPIVPAFDRDTYWIFADHLLVCFSIASLLTVQFPESG